MRIQNGKMRTAPAHSVVLRDGFTYVTRNGRVVKLYRRGVLAPDDGEPSTDGYPWVAHIEGEPRAGGRVLYYTDNAKVWLGDLRVDIGFDIVAAVNPGDTGTNHRLIPKDRRHSAIELLIEARASGVEEEIWVAKDGRQFLVGQMDEDHLRSTLRMLIKQSRQRLFLKKRMEHLEAETEKLLGDLEDDHA